MSKLPEIFKIANIHADRINMALTKLKPIFPLDAAKIKNFSIDEIAVLDFLVHRFAKLQDYLGRKVFNEVLLQKGEYIEDLSMIDKINLLERLKVIPSADIWNEMRNVRNHISHEYPDNPELTAQYLNEIYALTPKLLEILANIQKMTNI
jgi:hypothetical protein